MIHQLGNMLIVALSCMVAMDSAKLAPELKVGSDFVWHVAHCDTIKAVKLFDAKQATVKLDQESEKNLSDILPELKTLRANLEPYVKAYAPQFLDGELIVIFGLTPKNGRQRFLRIHFISRTKPFVIDHIEELSLDDVIDELADGNSYRIQVKPSR